MTAQSQAMPKQKMRLATRLGNGALGANAALAFAFLYLPVLILITYSFNNTRSVAVFTGFSTEWYSKLITNEELLDAARNSLLVGATAMLGATLIGTMTALGMDRFRFRGRTTIDANMYLPIVIPEIVMGIALLLFFHQALFPFIERVAGTKPSTGLATITLAHIAFDIPFVYVIVRARLADFDRALEEAAQDLGANLWRTFQRVTLPLLMPGIIGGALMAFTLSLDDYLITAYTKGVQEQTMPLYIYSLVRRGVTPEINALSTALLAGSMGLVGLSLAAQSGVRAYTGGMAVGARLGLALFGLLELYFGVARGAWGAATLLYIALAALPLPGLRKQLGEWRTDMQETNLAGRGLAIITMAVVVAAVMVSLRLVVL